MGSLEVQIIYKKCKHSSPTYQTQYGMLNKNWENYLYTKYIYQIFTYTEII
jgi:hypothetical protein